MRTAVLLIAALAVIGSATAYKSYSGYQVLRTKVLDHESLLKLKPLIDRPEFDFWSTPRVGNTADIMVAPGENLAVLRNTLERLQLEPEVLIEDVEVVIQKERAEIEAMRAEEKRTGVRAPPFDRFMDLAEIEAYLDEIVATYPNIASLINIGSSYEGRPLRVLRLSNGPGKSAIWYDAVMHAREWAGPPTALFMINELTENLANNQAMLDANDFYILPIANPDGYAYTWTNERLWRKTRNPNSGSTCLGTDPNRNYDYAWGQGGNGPCSETFPGSAAESAPEVAAVTNFLRANPQITMTVNIHSYGQYILTPWGDTGALPPTYSELIAVADEAASALEAVRGTVYTRGSTWNTLYAAYGLMEDWAYASLGCPMVFVIELPGGGSAGFNPPPSSIGPVTTETWEAFKVFNSHIPASRN